MRLKLSYVTLLLPALAFASGCGQRPAFADKTAQRTTETDGTDAGPGTANANPKNNPGPGGASGGTGTSGTTPDAEPPSDGHSPGATDSGGSGDDDTTGGTTGGGTGGATGGSTSGTTPDGNGNDNRKTKTTDATYNATQTAPGSVTKTLDTSSLSSQITMIRNYNAKAQTKTQIVRTPMTDTFNQGNSGSANTETFNQTANRPLDIVAVTDDSNSMGETDSTGQTKQAKVAARVMDLLSELGDTDWQIGVVTTDPSEGSLRGLIKKGDADVAGEFSKAWNAGTSSSNNERGFLQSVNSIQGTGLPSTWVRPNSTIAVLIVSDEDNCSAGSMANGDGDHQNNCYNNPWAHAPYLVNYLSSIRQIGLNARTYGIIWGPDQTQAQCPLGYNQGIEYAKAITATGGVWGSICDLDYSPTLQKISQDVQTTLLSNFTLMYTPDPTTVTVYVGTTLLTAGQFTVHGNVVSLATPPPVGTTVTVNYKYGAQPILSSFKLRTAPLDGSVTVTVNGVAAVAGTDYAVNGAGPSIDFAAPPAERAQIVVKYKPNIPLNTQFSLNDNIKPGTLVVTVNGVAAVAGTDYTEQDPIGLVTFAMAPPEGATLSFAYTQVGSAVLVYPFTTPSGSPQDLSASDTNTMAPINVLYLLGNVIFSAADFQEGRKVTLKYDNVARNTFEVDLPQAPVAGSVKATDGATTCTAAPQLVVTGQVVDVNNCQFAYADNQVMVDYTYVAAQVQDFDFTATAIPAPNAYQVWNVWVNGAASTDYVRTGGHFHFNNPLPAFATVKIELIQADQ